MTHEQLAASDPHAKQKAFTALSDNLTPQQKAEYRKARKEEKADWLLSFMSDPATGGAIIQNKTRRETVEENDSTIVWLTEEQLASPQWLNSAHHAHLATQCLKSQKHEIPSLALAGVLQYRFTSNKERWSRFLSKSAEASTSSDPTAEQYAEVEKDMADPEFSCSSHTSPRNKKRKAKLQPPVPESEMTPEQFKEFEDKQAKVDAETNFARTLKSVRSSYDKAISDLDRVGEVEERLKLKSYMKEPLSYLQKKTKAQRAEAEALFNVWSGGSKIDKKKESTENLLAKIDEFKTSLNSHDASMNIYKTTVLSEFASKS